MHQPERLSDYLETESTCVYTKHIDEIPNDQREETMSEQVGGITVDDNGYWHCPHAQHGDSDNCIFHTAVEERPENLDLGEYLVSLITRDFMGTDRDQRRRVKQFIGAELGDLDLNFEHIDTSDNLIIDLRCCTAEALHLESAEITNPVDIRGSDISRLSATGSSWHQLYAQGMTAELIEFDQATLQRAYFQDTEIQEARFYWTEIDYVNYHRCNITWGNFMYVQLGEAGFFNSEFHVATFTNANIGGGYFNDASFSYLVYKGVDGRTAYFSGVTAGAATFEDTELDKLKIEKSNTGAKFDWTVFDNAEIGILKIADSDIGITSIENAEIDILEFEKFSFHHIVCLDRTIVRERVYINPSNPGNSIGYISHSNAKIMAGEYVQPSQTDIIYDFTDAIIGDLNLQGDFDQSPLNYIRFYRTEYEGFKFGKLAEVSFDDLKHTIHTIKNDYEEEIQVATQLNDSALELHPAFGERDPLGASGKYNTVNFDFIRENGIQHDTRKRALETAKEKVGSDTAEELQTDLRSLETTYLRAKNGASNVGDSVTAGRFFEKERTYRRKRHWANMVEAETMSTRVYRGSQWVRNWLFAASAGYGERPLRVFFFSIGVVGLFTLAYIASGEPLAGVEEPSLLAYFLFSFQSFIAFVVGTPSGTDVLIIRLLSAFEGFIGAFVVGLFVFVLTRQVHR